MSGALPGCLSAQRRRPVLEVVRVAVSLALVSLAACGRGHPAADESRREVTLTAGGDSFHATAFLPPLPHSPGLLLLHDAGSSREDWVPFAVRAQKEGYLCLALDLGEGESDVESFRTRVQARVAAGLGELPKLGAESGDLGLMGAGSAGDLALEYAAEHPEVQALALLSPGKVLDGDRGYALTQTYGKRPLFLLTAAGDAYSAEIARRLRPASPGFAELREYSGTASGTDIFATSDNSVDQVLNWLRIVLPPPPAAN